MPNDINDLDVTDAGLKGIFGDRFHDETAPAMARPKKISTAPCKESNVAQKPTEKPMEAQWEPVRPEPNWMDKLKESAKSVLLFGGLTILVFYWQQAGLMASSIAVPTMCAFTALAGWGVGKNATR